MNVIKKYAIVGDCPKNYTYSNYQKTQIFKLLELELNKQNPVKACQFGVELHASGYFEQVLQILTSYVSESINTANPNLPSWWVERLNYFSKIKHKYHLSKTTLSKTRNNQECRNLLAEFITVLATSEKNTILKNLPKIKKKELDYSYLQNRLISQKNNYWEFYNGNNENSPYLKLGFQQYVNHLCYGNIDDIIWWICWLHTLERSNKKKIVSENQLFMTPLDSQQNTILEVITKDIDWIWIFWDFLLRYVTQRNSSDQIIQVKNLYLMYLYGLNKTNKYKKTIHLFHAILYVQPNVNMYIPVISSKQYLIQLSLSINMFYKRINRGNLNFYKHDIFESNGESPELQTNVVESKVVKKSAKQERLDQENEEYEKLSRRFEKIDQVLYNL